ncbi:MAG: hypothetical protein QNK23_11335 [Crocinitomicaceae bacterium]|nr:hypothetical protein [Crocinitomicaceae bacterium]
MSVDTTFDEMYRFEIGGQLIEITRLGSTISGEVINFIYEENKNSSEFDYENPIFIKTKIHEDTSLIIYEKLKMLDAIPDMSRIDGWGAGLDGAIYKLEYGTKKMYSLRSYWSPSAQSDSVKFKNEIILFIEFLRKDLQIESHSVLLWRHLESGTYTIDGFGIYPIIRKRKRKKRR